MSAVERELTLLVLPGGAPLFRQGEPADAVYVVASGCLGVFRHEDEGSADGAAPDGRDPARQHRGRDVAAVAWPAHAQRRGAARQRGLAPGARQLRQADRAASRGAADPDAQRRGAQRHGADQAPPPAAHLRHPADRRLDAGGALCRHAGGGPGAHRQPGADAGPRIDGPRPRMVRARRDRSLLRALSRRSHGHRMDRALPAPGRLPGRRALGRRRPADPPALRDRDGAVGRRLPSPPRAGAAARGPRSQAGLDGADAGRRSLRPASSRAARRPRRRRPAGAPADRACRRRRHGGRRGARLHPYRRHQGAARFRRADRPGRRHQHGRDRGGERRLALARRGDHQAFPRRLRRQQSAQRLHAAADLALRRTARHAAAAHCRSARRRSRT